MDVIYEKIKPNREIEIPEDIMKRLHLKVGGEIGPKVIDRKILLEPHPETRKLSGIIKIEDPDIDRFIESEGWRY